jgi:hypothetical protein
VALKGLGAAANTPSGIGLFVAHFPPGSKAFGILGAGQPLGFILGLVLGNLSISHWILLACSASNLSTRRYYRAKSSHLAGDFLRPDGVCFALRPVGLPGIAERSGQSTVYKGARLGRRVSRHVRCGTLDLRPCVSVHMCIIAPELTICRSDSASASKGWASIQVIACISTSVVLLLAFWYYERWREAKNLSVLIPPSMWRQPGAKMTAVILMVFFAWRVLSSYCSLHHPYTRPSGGVSTS